MSEESRKHNSHAAESWRELAGDVRQWADGHRLAITATVALVVLNLVVWLVVAMAGFAFPLRLDTSMAEFDFGKLFCTLFLARGVCKSETAKYISMEKKPTLILSKWIIT